MRSDFSTPAASAMNLVGRLAAASEQTPAARAVLAIQATAILGGMQNQALPKAMLTAINNSAGVLEAGSTPRATNDAKLTLAAGATPTRPTGQKVAPGMQLNS